MTTQAFIFARGGSKGLPKKNIKKLNGKPLLLYSIEIAKQIKEISKIFVSTDDDEIAAIAMEAGVDVIDRPEELATDDSPEILSWKQAIEFTSNNNIECTKFISIPTTAPLRTKEDIQTCLNLFDESTDVVVTISNSHRNPYFNMVSMNEDSYVELLKNDGDEYFRRQDVPKTYDLTTVAYVSRPEYIMSVSNLFEGRVKAVKIPKERSIDIDNHMDFMIAEMMIKQRSSENEK